MAAIRADADLIIDSSNLNVHQLTDKVAEAFGTAHSTALKATVVSFGFKYGIPVDADLVADMRFLPNPHWVPELRPLSGRDEVVAEYVKTRPEAQRFLEQYVAVVDTVATGYLREGKRFMTVAIGCTGGKHRSVAMTEEIAARLRALGLAARPMHRDLGGSERARLAAGRHPRRRAGRRSRPRGVAGARCAGWSSELTAVVTVADNGGSSGRLRREFGVLPPGDLRQALAALCGDDDWGRTWARVLQHRFSSDGDMDEHAVGNLLIVALWELLGEHVDGLDWVGRLLGAQGRVLPMAVTPIDIAASVAGLDPADPDGRADGPRPGRGRLHERPGRVRSTSSPTTRRPAPRPWPPSRPPTGWCSGRGRGSRA